MGPDAAQRAHVVPATSPLFYRSLAAMCKEVFVDGSVQYAFTTIPTYPRRGLASSPGAARASVPPAPLLQLDAFLHPAGTLAASALLPACTRRLALMRWPPPGSPLAAARSGS